jgi:hypothetical protein
LAKRKADALMVIDILITPQRQVSKGVELSKGHYLHNAHCSMKFRNITFQLVASSFSPTLPFWAYVVSDWFNLVCYYLPSSKDKMCHLANYLISYQLSTLNKRNIITQNSLLFRKKEFQLKITNSSLNDFSICCIL